MRKIAAVALLAGGLLAAPIGTASSQGESCRFVLGFAALREQVGADKVGRCLEDERFNAENGNAEQRTSGGLLVWRKVDNFTAFTDGATSWIAGPEGLQSRPNGERFAWEKDPIQPTAARPSSSSASPAAVASPAPAASPAPGASTSATTGATAPTTATRSAASASPTSEGPRSAPTPPPGGGAASASGAAVGARNPNAGTAPVNANTCPATHPIKGNQGNEWIYHGPLSAAYRATQPERCFATSAEAEAAGYRPPQQ
jgi:hypothetical protein